MVRKGEDEVTPPPQLQTTPLSVLSDPVSDKQSNLSDSHEVELVSPRLILGLKRKPCVDIGKFSRQQVGQDISLPTIEPSRINDRKRLTI